MTETIPKGRYGCPQCPDRFVTLGDKKRHLRTEHPRPKGGS